MIRRQVRGTLLFAVLALAGWATNSAALPPDDVLQEKVLEVGRSLGWSQAHEDRTEGVFVWRVTLKPPGQLNAECKGLFAWYLKRVGDKVALYDPVYFPYCEPDIKKWDRTQAAQLSLESSKLQEDFKRRWLALVGPITIIAPTAKTHSQTLVSNIFTRLSKDASDEGAQGQPSK